LIINQDHQCTIGLFALVRSTALQTCAFCCIIRPFKVTLRIPQLLASVCTMHYFVISAKKGMFALCLLFMSLSIHPIVHLSNVHTV